MLPITARLARRGLTRAALALAFALHGCASAPPEPTLPPGPQPLERAVPLAIETLLAQARSERGVPAWWAQRTPRTVTMPASVDVHMDGQSDVTRRADQLAEQVLARPVPGYTALPPRAAAQAELSLSARLERKPGAPGGSAYVLKLVDLEQGRVLARTRVELSEQGLPGTPTAFFQDHPSTPRAHALPEAGDTRAQLQAAAQLQSAVMAYEANRFDEALLGFREAAVMPGVDRYRAQVGIYLSALREGRAGDAEAAFEQVVQLGLASRSLGLKLLFKPSSVDYWPDPQVNKMYPMWLRAVARQAGAARESCLRVVGHSSRTGSEVFNNQLSEQRAQAVQRQLIALEAALQPRLSAAGAGFRENIVGSGSDDLRDAVDRRVEFRIVACP